MSVTKLDAGRVADYLALLQLDAPTIPDLASLRRFARRHAEAVPFHNLDLQVDAPRPPSLEAAFDAVVRQRRGGNCFELNVAFAALLRSFGHRVDIVAARVWHDEALGIAHGHLALVAHCPGPCVVDVGFGDRWAVIPQDGPADPARARLRAAGPDLDVIVADAPWYRVDPRPRDASEFEAAQWYLATGPRTRLNRSLVCSIATPGGRVTLAGRRLIIVDGTNRHEEVLPVDSLLDAYREHFGLTLATVPRPRLGDGATDWFTTPTPAGSG